MNTATSTLSTSLIILGIFRNELSPSWGSFGHFEGCSKKWPNDTLFCFVCCGMKSQLNHVIFFESNRGDLIFAYIIFVHYYVINSLVYT